jgi:uncharacterized protein
MDQMEIRRIPLFPLNVVLFPGMVLPLHVFEPRYQQMVRLCLEGDRMFGVCLIRSGEEVGGPADPCPVGTTCEILSVTPLEEGRMNLATVGRERFRIRRLFEDEPFMEAEVELLGDEETGDLEDLPHRVGEMAAAYVRGILAIYGQAGHRVRLPEDPLTLSHAVGALLQAPLPERQRLLEAGTVAERLEREAGLLEQELEKLAGLKEAQKKAIRPLKFKPEDFCLN